MLSIIELMGMGEESRSRAMPYSWKQEGTMIIMHNVSVVYSRYRKVKLSIVYGGVSRKIRKNLGNQKDLRVSRIGGSAFH
jgi:hypothetical protein